MKLRLPTVVFFSLHLIPFLLLLSLSTPASAACPEMVRQYIVSGQENPVDSDLLAFSAVIHDTTGTCTATVLNNKYLLTAAHCSYEPGAAVRVSRRLRDGTPDSTVKRFVKHPQYSVNSILHDIAVVEIAPPLKSTMQYKQVQLHSGIVPKPPAFARVAGYGVVRPKAATAAQKGMGVFRRVDLPVVGLVKCASALKKENYRAPPQFRDNNYICAGYTGPNTCGGDACSGDSGGPIVIRGASGSKGYVQIGVTSAGATCGDARVPGIYTSVAGHLDWIKSVATTGDKLKIVDAFAKPPPPPKKKVQPAAAPKATAGKNINATTTATKADDNSKAGSGDNGADNGASNGAATGDNGPMDAGDLMATPSPEPGIGAGASVNGRVGATGLEKNSSGSRNTVMKGSVVSIISVSVIVGILLIAIVLFFAIRRVRNPTEFASEDFEGAPPSDLMARLGIDPETDDDAPAPPSIASDSDGGESNDDEGDRIPSAPAPPVQVGDTPSILGMQTVVPTARGGNAV